nr:hypothetical protein [Candidatus Sigynarchaeota archaeon]
MKSIQIKARSNAFIGLQISSSLLIILAVFFGLNENEHVLQIIFIPNSMIFFLALIGLDIVLLLKQDKHWSMLALLPLIPFFGAFLSMGLGYLL